ncbi:calcium ion binding protein [Aureococcus anophagefferens]|nr:calcium ion binding protein [Aureococcus anophagefferens]
MIRGRKSGISIGRVDLRSAASEPALAASADRHAAPTRTPYVLAPTADSTAFCQLRDSSGCSGDFHYFVEVLENGPFDGIDVGWVSTPALVDLDGDGDLDLVVGENYGVLYYYENVGSAASPSYAAVTGTANPFDGIDVGWVSTPALVDLDGDGDLDLVVGEGDGALFYYENRAALARRGDGGDLDLVVGESGGALFYYENVGSAASPSYEAVTGTANPFDGIDVSWNSTPALSDLDGDGDLDLVVGEENGALYYYENVGTGSASPFDGIDVGGYSKPALADLDGDGDLDLVVGYYDLGAVSAANPFDGIDVGGLDEPTFGDLDGDGDLDLVVGVGYYENVGSATSPSYTAVTGSANPFDGISVSALADLDGDGDLDLVVGDGGALGLFVNGYCGYFGATSSSARKVAPRTATRRADGHVRRRRERPVAGSCDDGISGSGVCTCCDVFSGSGCTDGTCPAGTVETASFDGSFNVAECVECEAGTSSAEGDDQCTKCAAGEFSAAGASECTSCSAGSYSGPGASECSSCAVGTFQDEAGQSSCKLADAGSFIDALGASEQADWRGGPVDLQARRGGQLRRQHRRVVVDRVPAGTYSATASEECAACEYKGTGAGACLDCDAAKYADEEGSSDCKLAEAGSFVDSTGASSSTACAAGVPATASEECATCEVGTYSTEGSDTCTLCSSGYSSDAEGASECEACPVGKYKGAGAGACIDCAAANEDDSDTCTLCSSGYSSDAEGASACSACPVGKYKGGRGRAPTAPRNADEEAERLQARGRRELRRKRGSVVVNGVPAGTYSATASEECTTCEVGTYSTRAATRARCARAALERAEGASACEACPVGTYKGAGASACLDCDAAKYADEEGSSDCKLAAAGSFVGSAGASSSTACPAGTYSATASEECTTCEVGTYSTEGSDTCTLCSSGYSSAAEGANACEACPVGTYKGAGAGACLDCDVAKYADEEGERLQARGRGSFVGSGASSSTACPREASPAPPRAKVYQVSIASSVTLDGVDADAFNGDDVAGQLATVRLCSRHEPVH